MIKNNEISFCLGIKKHSTRCKEKNTRPFGKTNLIYNKLDLLTKLKKRLNLCAVYVKSEDLGILNMIKERYGDDVITDMRSEFYASGDCDGSFFYVDLVSKCPGKHLIYAPVTSPFVSYHTYENIIRDYKTGEKMSIVTVANIQHHMWMNGKPLNYVLGNAVNSQDLPEIYRLTYGACMMSKELILKNKNFVGMNPYFYDVNEVEAIDIDTEFDFKVAELIYNERNL